MGIGYCIDIDYYSSIGCYYTGTEGSDIVGMGTEVDCSMESSYIPVFH